MKIFFVSLLLSLFTIGTAFADCRQDLKHRKEALKQERERLEKAHNEFEKDLKRCREENHQGQPTPRPSGL